RPRKREAQRDLGIRQPKRTEVRVNVVSAKAVFINGAVDPLQRIAFPVDDDDTAIRLCAPGVVMVEFAAELWGDECPADIVAVDLTQPSSHGPDGQDALVDIGPRLHVCLLKPYVLTEQQHVAPAHIDGRQQALAERGLNKTARRDSVGGTLELCTRSIL